MGYKVSGTERTVIGWSLHSFIDVTSSEGFFSSGKW